MSEEAHPNRLERDSLGEVPVPAERLWGAQTERSRHHFAYGQRMPLTLVHAFGQLKAACARSTAPWAAWIQAWRRRSWPPLSRWRTASWMANSP